MTHEEIFNRLQKKYSDAVRDMYRSPYDTHLKQQWQNALDDLLTFLSSFKRHAYQLPPAK